MNGVGARIASVATLALALTARAAEACPSCTTRSSGGYMIPILLGAMILTPYVVATQQACVYLEIRAPQPTLDHHFPQTGRAEEELIAWIVDQASSLS